MLDSPATTTLENLIMSANLCTPDALSVLATYWERTCGPNHEAALKRCIFNNALDLNFTKDWRELDKFVNDSFVVLMNETTGSIPEKIFDFLFKQNIKSLDARYPDSNNNPEAWFSNKEDTVFKFKRSASVSRWLMNGTPGQIHSILNSYMYQSCEDDQWRLSLAYQICRQLEGKLLDELKEDEEELTGSCFREPATDYPAPIPISELMSV